MPDVNQKPINHNMKKLTLLFASFLFATTITNAAPATKFDCDDLGSLVDQGGVPEKSALWKLGKAPGYARTFTVAWDMYGIPDRIIIKYRDADGPQQFESGLVSNTGMHTFKLTAKATQDVSITLNPGDGLSGTAWEYRMYQTDLNIDRIPLTAYSGGLNWRTLINGTNFSADRPIVFDVFGEDANEQTGNFIAKVFEVEIPNGIKAIRVRSGPGVQITMLKGCIPRPGQFVKGYSSRNRNEDNAVIFNEDTIPVQEGIHYITASITREYAYALAGLGLPDGSLALGNLSIDCFNRGTWTTATHTAKTRETESVLVGFESSTGANIPTGDITIISHGRANSPADMLPLGAAADAAFTPEVQYLNWSEASNSNPGLRLLVGTRFLTSAARKLAGVLRDNGVHKNSKIDFLGHSWGTYMGDALAARVGKFRRFFALDPARTAFGFNTNTVNFRGAALYSLAIYGDGSYGSEPISGTAHESVILDSDAFLPGTLHAEPILVMTRLLNGQHPATVQSSFAHAIGPDGADFKARPWVLNQYDEDYDADFGDDDNLFEVVLDTDGSGVVDRMRYFDINSPLNELVFQ